MNLIYVCVFYQDSYIHLLSMLLHSLYARSNIDSSNTEFLICTSAAFRPILEDMLTNYPLSVNYYIFNANTLFEAGCSRLLIFQYPHIQKYDNILYLDTDILINSDISQLFELPLLPDKLYALEEGTIDSDLWGGQFFDFSKYDRNTPAFTSGILLFRNSLGIRQLFESIITHIYIYIYQQGNNIPVCLDQPFIIYNAISQNKYDNQVLKSYVENNPSNVTPSIVVYHFPGGPGNYSSKVEKMKSFFGAIHHYWNSTHRIKIMQYGEDGFGHQLEGTLRLISLDLNKHAEYQYDMLRSYTYEHDNSNAELLKQYMSHALSILSGKPMQEKPTTQYHLIHSELRDFNEIKMTDIYYSKSVYLYDA